MKKKLIIITCAIVLLLGAVAALYFYETTKVGEFSIEDYRQSIAYYSSDEALGVIDALGAIDDAGTAKEKAEDLWIEIYGDSIKEERPYRAFYDSDNGAWLVTGTFHAGLFGNCKGGVANIIISESDGRVLAVWHEE